MKRQLAFFLSLIIVQTSLAQDFRGLNEADFRRINGVWTMSGSAEAEVKPTAELFSWGLGRVIPEQSIIIDLGADEPFYDEPEARFDILSIKKKSNTQYILNLRFRSSDNGWQAKRILNLHSDGSIWFEGEGESHLYRKIAGPQLLVYGQSTDNRVRIRKLPELDAEILGHLSAGQKVLLLDRTQKTMPIGDMDSHWYKIKTRENIIGWSYGYFIQIE